MTAQHTNTETIPALTGIRFFFALCAMLLHVQLYTKWLDLAPDFRDGFIMSGGVAVNFFFILSGFILTYTMTAPCSGSAPKGTARRFYLARFARIYPVYALGLVALIVMLLSVQLKVIVMPDGVWNRVVSLAAHTTLLQSWFPNLALQWNPPGWSLSAEALFYALFPFAAPVILRQKTCVIFAIALLCYATSLMIPLLCHSLNLVNMHNPNAAPVVINKNLYLYFPLIRFPEFLLGISAAGLLLKNRDFFNRYAQTFLWLGIIGVLAGLQTGQLWIPYLMLNNGALGVFACCLIIGLCGAQKNTFSDLMGSKIMVLLGQSSYALYIIHYPVLFLFVAWLPESYNEYAALGVYLVAVTLLSIVVFHFYERPFQKLILQRFKASKP